MIFGEIELNDYRLKCVYWLCDET